METKKEVKQAEVVKEAKKEIQPLLEIIVLPEGKVFVKKNGEFVNNIRKIEFEAGVNETPVVKIEQLLS